MTVARDDLDALTGLRFVAAFTIALGHSYGPILEITALGMPLFFTLSGFIIHYVYAEAFRSGWSRATREFAIARFSRLYPLYFVLLIYLMVRTPPGHALWHPQNFAALLAYLGACWTWWPFVTDGQPAQFFFISWSVSTEIFFYLCYALFLHRIAAIRSARTCLIVLAVFCFLAYAVFFVLFATRDLWEPMALHAQPVFIPRDRDFDASFYRWLLYLSPYCRLPEFVGGVLTCQLFLLSRRQRGVLDRVRPATLGIVGIAVMAVLFAQFHYFGRTGAWLEIGHFGYGAFLVNLHQNFLFAPCCYLLIFSLACGGWGLARALASGPARFLGDISYSTYLSHQLVADKIQRLGLEFGPLPLYLVVLMAVFYAVSWVLFSVIEMPAKRLLRRWFSRVARRPAAVSASE